MKTVYRFRQHPPSVTLGMVFAADFGLSTEQDAGRCVGLSCRVKTKRVFKEGANHRSPSKRYQVYGSSS